MQRGVFDYTNSILPYPLTLPCLESIDPINPNNLTLVPQNINRLYVGENDVFSLLLIGDRNRTFYDNDCINYMLNQSFYIFCGNVALAQANSAFHIIRSYWDTLHDFREPTDYIRKFTPYGYQLSKDIWNRYKEYVTTTNIQSITMNDPFIDEVNDYIEDNINQFWVGEALSNNGPFYSDAFLVTRSRSKIFDDSTELDLRSLETKLIDIELDTPSHINVRYNYKFSDFNDINSINFESLLKGMITGFVGEQKLPMVFREDLLMRNPDFNMFSLFWTTVGVPFHTFNRLVDVIEKKTWLTFYWEEFKEPELIVTSRPI